MLADNKDILFQHQFKDLLYHYHKDSFHEIDLDEKKPESILRLCEERLNHYKFMIQEYDRFSHLIKYVRSIYKLKQADDIERDFSAFVKTWTKLSSLYEKTQVLGKVAGLFKKNSLIRDIKDNIQLCEKLGYSIVSNLLDVQAKFLEIYSNRVRFVQEKYPYLRIEDTISDHQILELLISEDAFESKEFKNLHNKLLKRNKYDKVFSLSELKFVLDQLKDPIKNKRYFTNVGKLSNIIGRPSSYTLNDMVLANESIVMYFDDDFVRICTLLASIQHTSLGLFHGFNPGFFADPDILDPYAVRHAYINNKKLGNGESKRVIASLETLSQGRFRVDVRRTDMEYFLSFAFNLTPEFARLLLEFKITRIDGHSEGRKFIENFIEFCGKNDYLISKRTAMKAFWNETISETIRDVHSLYEFFFIFAASGSILFERLLSSKIKLMGYEMDGIFEKIMGNEGIEGVISGILSDRSNNAGKMLVLAMTTTDHNGAFSYGMIKHLREQCKGIYLVNVCYTSTPYELEYKIHEIAKIKKIDVLLIAGHGDPDGISLGRRNLTSLDVKKNFNNMRGCFSKDAKCFLIACSTGKGETPIAKLLADKLGIPVTGPESDSSHNIIVDKEGEIIVEYGSGVNPKCFRP